MREYQLSAARAGLGSVILSETGTGGTYNIVQVGVVWYPSFLTVSFVFTIHPFV